MRTSRRTSIAAPVLALAVVISACGTSGGSDAGDDGATTTEAEAVTTTGAEETTTTATEDEADPAAQARADSVDLVLSDFPDGWEATPPTDPDAESPLNECDPALGDRSTQLARHATDDFSSGSFEAGDGTMFTARTVVFEDEAAAEAAMAPFSDPEVVACIDEALKSAYTGGGSDVTVEGSLKIGEADIDVDEAAALSGTYTVTSAADGSSIEVRLGVLALRTGDIATNLVVQSVNPEFEVDQLPVDTLVEALNAA